MTLMRRSTKRASNVCFVSEDCHPQTIAVVRTRAEALGIEIEVGDDAAAERCDAFGVLLQYPASTGEVRDYASVVAAANRRGALVAVAADLLALALLEPPGAWGAAIVVGNTQRFGVPVGYGGPHAAFLACLEPYKRSLPGRLVGVSVDARGEPAYRLALQTREQHIRREKATSNICTAQVLLAVMAAMYAVYHGPRGIERIARRTHRLTSILAAGLEDAGYEVTGAFFDTITVSKVDAATVIAKARARHMNLRDLGPGAVGISFDETTTRADVTALWTVFGVDAQIDELDRAVTEVIP
jgi:glycine dehydrogenase